MENIPVEVQVDNNCLLCGKPMTVEKRINDIGNGVIEVEYFLFHPACKRLKDKRIQLREELKAVEMKIFKKFIGE